MPRHSPSIPQHRSAGLERRTLIALAVTFAFMLVELTGGFLSGSLALLADAAHMLADVFSLAMAWTAFRVGRWDADAKRSFGYRRIEVLAGLGNGLTILILSGWIVFEAAQRLLSPQPVQALPMVVVAIIGFIANLVTLKVLGEGHGHSHGHSSHDHDHGAQLTPEKNLNLHGAWLHVLGDLLGSAAAVVAGLIIMVAGWLPIDPILSIVVAVLIVVSGYQVVRSALHILLEGSPPGFNEAELTHHLISDVPGLLDVHHVHAWSVSSGQPMLTLHAVLAPSVDHDGTLAQIKHVLAKEFGFTHSVVQTEGTGCSDHGDACH